MRKIKFEIKKPGNVEVRVVDVLGTFVVNYFNNYDVPGSYEVDFNDESLNPGGYFYKVYDLSMEPFNGGKSNTLRIICSGSIHVGDAHGQNNLLQENRYVE